MPVRILRATGLGLALALVAIVILALTVDDFSSGVQRGLYRLGVLEPAQRAQSSPNEEAPEAGASRPARWTPRQWRARVDRQYRLRPDRRYLGALAWLQGEAVTVESADGGWRVLAGGRKTAELPLLPDFRALYRSLRAAAWPSQSSPPEPPAGDRSRRLHLQDLLTRLGDAPTAAALRQRPRALRSQAEAAARLLLVLEDPLETADALAIRALGAVALAEAAGAALPLERSLVAYRLGYTESARRIAAAELEPAHPWRSWLERRPITADDSSPFAIYLRMRHAASRLESAEQWRREAAIAARHPDLDALVVLLSANGLSRSGVGFRTLSLTPFATFAAATGDIDTFELADVIGALPRDPEVPTSAEDLVKLLSEAVRLVAAKHRELQLVFGAFPVAGFERALESTESERAGVAPGLRRIVLRSIFYGAVDRMVDLQLFARDDIRQAQLLVDSLKNQPGRTANALAVLYTQHIATETGDLQRPGPLLAELRRLPLGPAPLWRTLHAALERSSWREGVRTSAFHRYSGIGVPPERATVSLDGFLRADNAGPVYPRDFDSRPDDRHRLLSHAETTLYRPLLAARLRGSLDEVQGRYGAPAIALERARLAEDVEAVADIAHDPAISRAWRARAALTLSELGAQPRAEAVFTNLVFEDPGDWEVREEWIEVLQARDEHARARRIASEWYRTWGGKRGSPFDVVDAVIAEADSALQMGDIDAALRLVNGIVGYTGAAREYRLVVRLLLELEKDADARRAAELLHRRYPRSLKNLLPLVAAHWCLGKYESAAEVLLAYPRPLTHFAWRDDISPVFARCLGERPDAAARASEQLQASGADPRKLKWIARHLHDNGASATAFAIVERLRAQPIAHQLFIDIDGYAYIKADRGPEAAFEWFASRVPESMRGPVSELIYWKGHHELLWSLVPDDFARANHRDAVWMLRAMGLAVGRAYSDERLQRAETYLRREGRTRYARFGRLVLGFESPGKTAAQTLGDRELVETTYALGVRAVVDGQPREALRWFAACMVAGQRHTGEVEYRWARAVLARVAPLGDPDRLLLRYGPDVFMPWGPEGSA